MSHTQLRLHTLWSSNSCEYTQYATITWKKNSLQPLLLKNLCYTNSCYFWFNKTFNNNNKNHKISLVIFTRRLSQICDTCNRFLKMSFHEFARCFMLQLMSSITRLILIASSISVTAYKCFEHIYSTVKEFVTVNYSTQKKIQKYRKTVYTKHQQYP